MAESKVLLVRLAKELYAMPITAIEEVLPALPIESLPQSPGYVRGVVFVRGHLIPVLSAAERLGLAGHRPAEDPAIVCLRVGKRLVGLEFDEALDLMDLGPAEMLGGGDLGLKQGFFTGVVERDGRIIRLLNPEKMGGEW